MLDPHNDTAQTLYEGDQSKLYSGLLAHHDGNINDNASKTQIKRILKVTLLLAVVTIIEVGLGLYGHYKGMNVGIRNTFFIIMTILKAAYIVKVFMHLGDEFKNFLIAVMIPLFLFIWFIIAFLADGHSWLRDNQKDPVRNERLYTPQGN
jgi:cytochrome c oxidase subunit IV